MKKQILSLLLISSSIQLLGVGSLSDFLTKATETAKKIIEKGQPLVAEEAVLYKKYLYEKYGPALVDQYILGEQTDQTLPEPVAKELALYKKYLFKKYGQPLVDAYILGKAAKPVAAEDLPELEPTPESTPAPTPQQPKQPAPGDLTYDILKNMDMTSL